MKSPLQIQTLGSPTYGLTLDLWPKVGSNSSTAPIIEQSFLDSIQLLELHLKARPYLFGGCPSLADFGLWGQLYQCFSDVLAGELIRLHAPKLALWCEDRRYL